MRNPTKLRATARLLVLAPALVAPLFAPQRAMGKQVEALPPAPPPAAPTSPLPPTDPALDVAPPMSGETMPAATAAGGTDHDSIVRRWGIEARRIATLQRTPNQDPSCRDNCPVDLNAFGVRRWVSRDYAYSFGLALAAGGGSTRVNGDTASWDTYLGVGPTLGASFLLGNFRHLAVSFSPQLDTAFFLPAASRPKTLLVNARGLFEGELHLGFWGIPQLSVGVSSGLAAGFRYTTAGENGAGNNTAATDWSLGTTGPQSLWGIVTNMFVRFYL